MALTWSRDEARLYQLAAVGLHGKRYPEGEDGIREVFRDLRAVQLDPLPILGRNHDLVLQSRVGGTHPGMFLDLLHHQRLGFEYWDKMLCAIPIAEFPYFWALMEAGGSGGSSSARRSSIAIIRGRRMRSSRRCERAVPSPQRN